MSITFPDKYVTPLTDFGFKKLFGSEPNKKLFEAAEIAKFTLEDREAYQSSLKYYRDIKNVVDTSKKEGIEEVAYSLKQAGMPNKFIIQHTGLSEKEIENL